MKLLLANTWVIYVRDIAAETFGTYPDLFFYMS